MAKIKNAYKEIGESRKRIVKAMQERGIKELAMYMSYGEWCKENDREPEEDEDDDKEYVDYKDYEAPYVIFFDKWSTGIDYRVDKVVLKEGDGGPRLEFDCYANEYGSDTFGEDDVVFLTLYNVYEATETMLGIEAEPEKVWIVKQEGNDDGEMHFFSQPCKDEATAKSMLREWKEALLTKHPKYCDAKPYIDGEKDPDDQACCYEWENEDEDSFYIKVICDDYYENISIEEKEII